MLNNQRTGYSVDTFAPPLRLSWKYQRGDMVWAGPAIDSERVYLGGESLYAVALETGELIWRSEPLRAFGGVTAVLKDGLVYTTATDHLYAIETASGKVKFQVAPGSRESSPCVHEGLVYWGGIDGRLYAADAEFGTVAWSFDTGDGEALRVTPSTMNETVYVAGNRAVFALDVATGELRWKCVYADEPQLPEGSAAILQGRYVLGVKGLGVLGIDVGSGEIKWRVEMSHGPFTAPCAAEPDGIAYIAGSQLCAIAVQDGRQVWASQALAFKNSSPIIVGDYIFIGGGYRRSVYAFERRTGEKAWEYPTGDLVFSTPAYANGRLVIGSHDGNVYCFEET